MLLHSENLTQQLENRTLLLDTGAVIAASESKQFSKYLKKLANSKVRLIIVPAVYAEFTKYAKTLNAYKELESYLTAIRVRVYLAAENVAIYDKEFNVRMRNACPKASYVDALLCKILYMHRREKFVLVTTNSKDMPHFFYKKICDCSRWEDI